MKSVINFDSNLYKTVDLILVERIKKTFVSAGSWQSFKLKIVAKRDLSEQPKLEWMCGFYKNHLRLGMAEISKVLLN
jgi:hypothetical protein